MWENQAAPGRGEEKGEKSAVRREGGPSAATTVYLTSELKSIICKVREEEKVNYRVSGAAQSPRRALSPAPSRHTGDGCLCESPLRLPSSPPPPFHLEDEEVWPQLFLRQQACSDLHLGPVPWGGCGDGWGITVREKQLKVFTPLWGRVGAN